MSTKRYQSIYSGTVGSAVSSGSLGSWASWLVGKGAEIPAEHRHTATISFEADGDAVWIDIGYLRPLTPEEQAHHDELMALARKGEIESMRQRLAELEAEERDQ